jgi:hypothetical protein
MRGGELSREVGLARRTCSMPVEGGATVTLEGGMETMTVTSEHSLSFLTLRLRSWHDHPPRLHHSRRRYIYNDSIFGVVPHNHRNLSPLTMSS